MIEDTMNLKNKVYFITGGARRIGAAIAENLHASGANLLLHYRNSSKAAKALAEKLNHMRPGSVVLHQADLGDVKKLKSGMQKAIKAFGRLDGLINNASSFYPTPLEKAKEEDWDALFNSNLKGAFFLSQAALPHLKNSKGVIINITDIFAEQPMPEHSLYCAAKAGLLMLTKSLAMDLAPEIRVNAIAPGAILWPEQGPNNKASQVEKLARVPLGTVGEPRDIVQALVYLLSAKYVTGQVISVDGGRRLT